MDASILGFYERVEESVRSLPRIDEMLFYTGSPDAEILVVSEAPTLPNGPGDHTLYHAVTEEIIADHPRAVYEVAEVFPQLASGTGAILDYVTQLRLPQQQRTLTDTSPEDQLADLRDKAHTMVGELFVMYESLRRVAVRHPEIEYEQWQASTAPSGGR